MRFPRGEAVTVYNATLTTDRYGNEVSTWAAGTTYQHCVVSARRTDDLTNGGRQGTIVGLKVLLPTTAEVDPHDRLEVRGSMYEIVGEPFAPSSPFTGLTPGVSVDIRRVEG